MVFGVVHTLNRIRRGIMWEPITHFPDNRLAIVIMQSDRPQQSQSHGVEDDFKGFIQDQPYVKSAFSQRM